MKKTRLVIFFCLILAFFSIVPSAVFAAESKNIDLLDDISDMFVPKQQYQQQEKVVLGGIPIGISLNNDCVEIVGFSQIITENGAVSPAERAGMQIGDKIVEINGQKVTKTQDVKNLTEITTSFDIVFVRDGSKKQTEILSEKDVLTGKNKLGMWLRDESHGVGTLTFVKDEKYFASLGHPITSKDGEILSISGGKVHDCNILGVNKGKIGKAGELKGAFNNKQYIGDIYTNNKFGVYGKFDVMPQALDKNNIVEIANPDEIKPGKAMIYSTINGTTPQFYEIEIIKVKNQAVDEEKSLVIKVTDKKLLSSTGGIVQGMSGSPILQNDKLVGAVTHVFINDPTRGFGVNVHSMLNSIKQIY